MKLIDIENLEASALLSAFDSSSNRQESATRFLDRGLPTLKTEAYQYFRPKLLWNKELTFLGQREVTPAQEEQIRLYNGQLVGMPMISGVRIEVKEGVQRSNSDHFDPMYHFSSAVGTTVVCVDIDESVDQPINIVHEVDQTSALVAYRVEINVAPNTQVTCYETFNVAKEAMLVYGMDTVVGNDATLNFYRHTRPATDHQVTIGAHTIEVGRQATLNAKSFDFGLAQSLHTYHIKLDEYADVHTDHMVYATDEARIGNIILMDHIGRHSKSKQQAKNILNDRATAIFDGTMRVGEHAQHSAAHQNAKSMLLSSQSGIKMAVKPHMEIFTDELEASHGSSMGQLDETQMFYLRSRGLSGQQAKNMLLQAFAMEMINAIDNEGIQEAIHESFELTHKG
jgi:Fe-S cluster assembly protein SufD